jgi:hypothetical protein
MAVFYPASDRPAKPKAARESAGLIKMRAGFLLTSSHTFFCEGQGVTPPSSPKHSYSAKLMVVRAVLRGQERHGFVRMQEQVQSMTSEANEVAAGSPRYRRLFGWLLVLVGILLIFWGYNKILPVERIDQARWGSAENAESYFSRPIPTAQDIESYLLNATILVSDPPGGNAVYYFDAPYHFLKWRNFFRAPADDVLEGTWSIDWYLLPMELNGRWRVALEQVICTRSPDSLPADVPFCHDVQTLSPMLRFGRYPEYRVGNVFNLSANGSVPFPIPKTSISIDELVAIGKAQTRQ